MKKARNALFVLAAISSGYCGGTPQPATAPISAQPAIASASLDAMHYMPTGSGSVAGMLWGPIVKSGFLMRINEPFVDEIRALLTEECALTLDTDLQSLVVAFSSNDKMEPTTIALQTKVPRAQLQKCIETLSVGDDALSKDWQRYWPSDSLVILSTERTTEELQALGLSEHKQKVGIAAQMKLIDRDAPLWVAMNIPLELIEAASLPLAPTFLSANIRLSENSTPDLFLQFNDSFGVDSALELFTLMKAPALTRLGLDNDTVFDAKRVGSDLQLTIGGEVLSSTYRELKAMSDDEEQYTQYAPGTIPAPDDVAAPPADAIKTAKGVYYKLLSSTLTPGQAREIPNASDTVTVHYTGWTTDGKMFDSSRTRGKTIEFRLNGVIAGWTDGLQQMAVGENVRFWIPEDLAYKGRSGAPKGMLVFDVELLGIKQAPKVPDDLKRAPKTALKTRRGIKYKFLKRGTGGQRPNAWDKVTAHY
ncbi:MAG: FKBP-type peptidyl-prolyl cis-trans isomerase, partial [Kofleriaceae bacterium]|nr:FKBP-type peptidyl-prolyl cis-trans isomerase [Kofleriaceae bacterium]